MLAAIAFDHANPTSVDRVVELVWGVDAPATARKAVHNHVLRLRRAEPCLLETTPGGYRLSAHILVDAAELERLVDTEPDVEEVSVDLADEIAFSDLATSAEVLARRHRLRSVQATLSDNQLQRLVDSGRYETVALLAESLLERDAYRERRWCQLVIALSRTGRRREALQALQRARDSLALKGLGPGEELRLLERQVIEDPVSEDSGGSLRRMMTASRTAAPSLVRAIAGEQLHHLGDPRAVAVLFAAADDAIGSGHWDAAAHAAIAICRIGPTSSAGSTHHAAVALVDRVLPYVRDGHLRAALSATATTLFSMDGQPERCRSLFDSALRDAEAIDSDETWLAVLPYAYQSVSSPADLDQRLQLTERLSDAALRLDDPGGRWSALHLRFSNELQLGDHALFDTASMLQALAPAVREHSRDWENHYVQAAVEHIAGRLESSEAIISSSLSFAGSIAESRVMAVYGVQLLGLRLQQRRLHELYPSLSKLAEDQPGVAAWHAARAVAAAQAGVQTAARQSFDRLVSSEGVDLALDQTYTAALVALGEAAVELGDVERAARIEPHLRPWSGRWSWSGTCTLGPIDATLTGLASVMGDGTSAAHYAARTRASVARLGAVGWSDHSVDLAEDRTWTGALTAGGPTIS